MVRCQVLEEQLKTIVLDHDATQKQRQEEVAVISECSALSFIAISFAVDYLVAFCRYCAEYISWILVPVIFFRHLLHMTTCRIIVHVCD